MQPITYWNADSYPVDTLLFVNREARKGFREGLRLAKRLGKSLQKPGGKFNFLADTTKKNPANL